MRILFLTNLLPYPLNNGGKIKTYTTLKSMHLKGFTVDLVCFYEESKINKDYQNEIIKLCNSVHQLPLKLTTADNKKYMMKKAFFSLFSNYSFGVYKYYTEEMVDFLEKILKDNKYDCIYYDHLQLCVYKKIIDRYCLNAKSILDEHNCESLIIKRNSKDEKNFLKKIFLKIEFVKLRIFETNAIKSSDITIVLSKDDRNELQKMVKKDFNHTIIPIGIQRPQKIKHIDEDQNSDTMNILFVGSLTWSPNDSGMVWYLKNVMPVMCKKYGKFHIYIVGKNPSANLKNIASNYENVTVTGYVDSVDSYYDKCDFMIVPLFVGSGQRVKIIEAFSRGMPVLSTSIGAEGLEYMDDVNIIIANSVDDFFKGALKLRNTKKRKEISSAEVKLYDEKYSIDVVSDKICSAVESILF